MWGNIFNTFRYGEGDKGETKKTGKEGIISEDGSTKVVVKTKKTEQDPIVRIYEKDALKQLATIHTDPTKKEHNHNPSDSTSIETEDGFQVVQETSFVRPPKNKSYSIIHHDKTKEAEKAPKSGHVVNVVKIYSKQKKSDEPKSGRYFFKHHDQKTMAKLEVTLAEYYRFLGGQLVAPAWVIYDENNNSDLGVLSKGIDRFKSLKEDPLTDEDIAPIKNLSPEKAKEIIIALNNYEEIERKLRELTKKKQQSQSWSEEDQKNLEKVEAELQKIKDRIPEFNSAKLVAGLAVGLTLSYIFEEDDMHRGNISKYGHRIDFDMSGFSLLYLIKGARSFTDITLTHPTEAFPVKSEDIVNFPVLKHAQPFYWPATDNDETGLALTRYVAGKFSDNQFSKEEQGVFAQLKDNPIFIHYKFKTLLKFILLNKTVFEKLTELHVSKEETDERLDGNVIKVLTEHQKVRLEQFNEELKNNEQFRDFIENNPNIIDEIVAEFEPEISRINNTLQKRNIENPSGIYSAEILRENYNSIKKIFEGDKMLSKGEAQNTASNFCESAELIKPQTTEEIEQEFINSLHL